MHRALDGGSHRLGDAAVAAVVGLLGLGSCLFVTRHALSSIIRDPVTGHLRPTAPIFTDVLLPSDPGVALALAQRVLLKPLMANHEFGLWGYSGETQDGRELTIQSAGIGGPSAVTVLLELAGFGAQRVIALGTCTPLDPTLSDDAVVIAASARPEPDPGSPTGVAVGDPALTAAVAAACPGARTLAVASAYTHTGADIERAAANAAALDLATAAVFATATDLGLAVASALIVAGEGSNGHKPEELVELGVRAARAFSL